ADHPNVVARIGLFRGILTFRLYWFDRLFETSVDVSDADWGKCAPCRGGADRSAQHPCSAGCCQSLLVWVSTTCLSCAESRPRSLTRSLLTVVLWSAIAFDSLPLTALPAYLGAHPLTTEFTESIADVELRSHGLAVALFPNRSTAAFASCVR